MKKIVSVTNAPSALGPYNHANEANGFVFTSGEVGIDPATGKLAEGVEAQAAQALTNLAGILADAGCTMQDVVKTTVFLQDMADFPKINAIYKERFERDFPCRSCIEVAKLPGGALFEIEAVAAKRA